MNKLTFWGGMLGRRVAATGLSLAMLGLAAVPAAAATNHVGKVQSGWGICWPWGIQVTAPIMVPAPIQRSDGSFSTAPPRQRVAFRANLAQYRNGRWVTIRNGLWFTQKAGGAADYGLVDGSWKTPEGQPLPATLGFDRLEIGTKAAPIYYAVWYDYYWYADQYRDEGRATGWADGHQDNRGSPQGTGVIDQTAYEYCKYPGPNWLS
jgi:hypothetical protein